MWSSKLRPGLTGSHTREDQRITNWHYSLYGMKIVLKSLRLMSDLFHACALWSSFILLNYYNFKNNWSPFIFSQQWNTWCNGVEMHVCRELPTWVFRCARNVLRDSAWVTPECICCSLQMANKQPFILLHIFNFRVMWIHPVPSIQACHLLRRTSGTKEKKTRTNVHPEWQMLTSPKSHQSAKCP